MIPVNEIAHNALALLFGAIGGGLISALISWRMLRADTARQLLAEALAIQSEKEAWILEGEEYSKKKLTDNKNLSTIETSSGIWLRQVEVRAVLDEAQWTPLSDQEYGFIEGRRAWIVRNLVSGPPAHTGLVGGGWHPALASSRALEGLCGWVEQVAVSVNGRLLRKCDLVLLKPLLLPLCTKDRIEVLGTRLSETAKEFLKDCAKEYKVTLRLAKEERYPPERLTVLRDAWFWYMKSWRVFHYSLGLGGTVCATAVAAQPALLREVPYLIDSLAWFSAVCIGVLTAFRPHSRANAYAASWRILNDACNRYALDSNFTMESLLDAATKGEQLIQASDPVA